MSLSHSVLSQSGPPKSVGSGRVGSGRVAVGSGRVGSGRVGGSYTTLQLVKLDETSIENGLEGQKFLVVCLFWGDCHHPNKMDLSYTIQISSQARWATNAAMTNVTNPK